MGIKSLFTAADIKAGIDKEVKRIEQAIIMRFMRLGEECVNNARSLGDYTDRTGNLRSSIGYVVMADGREVKSNFLTVSNGDVGQTASRSLAQELSKRFATGYALIVVAGMDYAFYVEATGHNVLSSSEHLAKVQMPIMLQQLKSKLK